MKKISKIIWGVLLVAAGVVFALNALGVTDIDIFFDGWWTLLIILPFTVTFITEKDKLGSLIGLGVGVFLLLCCQDVLDFSWAWKLLIPAIIVITGLRMLCKGIFSKKGNGAKDDEPLPEIEPSKNGKNTCAVFSGNDLDCSGEVFEGGSFTAVFGGIECDLRNATIEKDCVIRVAVAFGGVDILLPKNVKARVDVCSVFGGTQDKSEHATEGPTVLIKGFCVFGGVDVLTKKED